MAKNIGSTIEFENYAASSTISFKLYSLCLLEKFASKANAKIAETQSLTRKNTRARKPTQKVLKQQQQESETEESELSEIEKKAELEEIEELEKELTEANNKFTKELKKAFTDLTLKEIQKRIPNRKKMRFKPFDRGYQREPIALIPDNVDPKDPLQLLNLFISPKMYELIARNTNEYAKTKESLTTTTATKSNRRI